ncbi:CsbD family protein [Streptomyces sp. NPDC058052]|uniref:CsbD family protein n=1 Tax=Streptomyces sp. NPDC058052 TaxID=3346316 RepID=UPI0036ECB3F2
MGTTVDRAKGKVKEIAGKLTGDERMEAEGRTDRTKADLKKALRSLRKHARGVADSLRRKRS